MREYTLTIAQRTDDGEENVFEFSTDNKNVLYTLEPKTYEESKALLKTSLDYMNDVKVDETLKERPTEEQLRQFVEEVRVNLR